MVMMKSVEVSVEPREERLAHPEGFSPAGLKVLVVDDDLLCLMILERMLRQCEYTVTTCSCATKALSMLRENRSYFDLVISDVYMPDMDGFKLLEAIGLELDLPVIMMSGDGDTDVVMKGIIHGACDYLLKPVRLEELRNIWQHIVRKRVPQRDAPKEEFSGEWDDAGRVQDADFEQTSRKRKEKTGSDDSTLFIDDINSLKKARVVWSVELHQQFVNAVNQLGVDKAVPKRILDIMNVQGLTRENVASHLQKYRLYLKRLSGVNPQPYPVASFQAAESGSFGGMMQIQPGGRAAAASSSKGVNLGTSQVSSGLGKTATAQIDQATMTTLAQLQMLQQKQEAGDNLSGPNSNPLNLPATQSTPVAPPGLQRMDSFELDLLMKAQYDVGRQRGGVTTNLTALLGPNSAGDLNSLLSLGNLRGQEELAPLLKSRQQRRPAEVMTAMSMSNLRAGEDMVGLSGIGLATDFAGKFGGDFSSSSPFSTATTLSNGGVSENSFTDYGEFPGGADFLPVSTPDISLLSQLEAFEQAEGDNGQPPARPLSFSS